MTEAAPLLPTHWVDKIFHALTMLYGRDFLGRWEGVPIDEVKAHWAEVLGCFVARPEAIKYALKNLHENKSPTALDFRAVCLRCPTPVLVALDAPAADPARVAAEFAKMATPSQDSSASAGPNKAWARDALAKHAAGIKISLATLLFARQALGLAK